MRWKTTEAAGWVVGWALLGATTTSAQTMELRCGKGRAGQELTAASRFGVNGAAAGFDLVDSPGHFTKGVCWSDTPFFVSVAVPEGNYRVTVVLGSGVRSVVTVRAESRRLMVDRKTLAAGASATETFNVSVRVPEIAGTDTGVRLKPREVGALDWDRKLTLEFNGEHPGFRSLRVERADDVPTLYLAGDSTVVDQDKEPWAAWGQMLPAFFGPGLVVANEAESGETIRSFTGERRFAKIMSTLRAGDFVMIQFAHNDQKNGTPAATDFAGSLRMYADAIRGRGATPILVTSMNRRVFGDDGEISDTLGGYPQAMRAFAAEQHVALIDLNAMSKTLFEAMGPEGTLRAFVHYPAGTFADQPAELKDDTHFNAYGAYELARAVVQGVRDEHLALARFLRPGVPAFDPAHPDSVLAFRWAPSPIVSVEKPYGN